MLAGRIAEFEDTRFNYGERRLVCFGIVTGRLHVCVYTVRADGPRSISVRKANDRERKRYGGEADGNPDWSDFPATPLDPALKLHSIRARLRMSQGDLADLLHVPRAILQNWEQKRTEPGSFAQHLIDVTYVDPEGMRDRLKRADAA